MSRIAVAELKKISILLIWIVLCLAIPVNSIHATITTATSDGDWDSGSTWDNGIPSCGDTVWIDSNVTVDVTDHVELDETSSPACSTAMFIYIEGELNFSTGKKLYLPCGSSVQVADGGSVTKGNGGGNSNVIDVCQTTVWNAGDGDVSGPFIITGNGLPITLKSFQVRKMNDRVRIFWTTLSEINNDIFLIQRTTDFNNIEDIASINGAGNSRVEESYEHYDANPTSGISYYRLKQVDFDGAFTVSDWKAVNFDSEQKEEVTVFNDVENRHAILQINNHSGESVEFNMFDLSGRMIKSQIIIPDSDSYTITVNKQEYPSSEFLLYVIKVDRELYTFKVVH